MLKALLFALLTLCCLGALAACQRTEDADVDNESRPVLNPKAAGPDNPNRYLDFNGRDLRTITLAGGCFWGSEVYLGQLYGVAETEVGYANGHDLKQAPSYEEVCSGRTGCAEVVRLVYDPERLPLVELLKQFYSIIDPTSLNRQGGDRGEQYRTGIYYSDEADRQVAEKLQAELQKNFAEKIQVEIRPLENYYAAEDYHQDYLVKNPGGYCHVNLSRVPREPLGTAADGQQNLTDEQRKEAGSASSATDQAAEGAEGKEQVNEMDLDKKNWQKPNESELREQLTAEQYAVTQEAATERPFHNAYWQEERAGLYVDIVSGEPLFSSDDKFDSGCGWPAFSKPIRELNEKRDSSYGMERVEVRSQQADSHLGHVFEDGPPASGGLRYCINSAALRFIPWEDLEAEGYGAWRDKIRH